LTKKLASKSPAAVLTGRPRVQYKPRFDEQPLPAFLRILLHRQENSHGVSRAVAGEKMARSKVFTRGLHGPRFRGGSDCSSTPLALRAAATPPIAAVPTRHGTTSFRNGSRGFLFPAIFGK